MWKKEGQERREEKERKGIESLNGSGERKEALETTAAAAEMVAVGEGGWGRGGRKKMAFIHGESSEANQMKRKRSVRSQEGQGEVRKK